MKVTFETNVTFLVMEIIKSYFIDPQLYGIIVLYDYPIEGFRNMEYIYGIENALKELSSDRIVLQWIQINRSNLTDNDSSNAEVIKLIQQHVDTGSEAYITVTNVDAFLSMKFQVQQNSTQRMRDKKFLFLSDQIVDDQLFQHPAFDIYPHHLLVTRSRESNNSLDLHTQKFVGIENRQQPLLLDTFHLINCSFERNATLYPDKLENLQGRVLNVSAIEYYPYAYAIRKEPNENLYREWNSTEKAIFFDGSEARIIINFCAIRNCTLEFRLSYDWGCVDPETGCADGQTGVVYLHQADIAVSSIGQWYFDYFDSSAAIARSASTLLVPGPKPLPYALTPILPFSSELWLYVFCTLLAGIILLYFVIFCSEFLVKDNILSTGVRRKDMKTLVKKTVLDVIGVFLQQGVRIDSSKIAVIMVYSVLLIGSVVIENGYSGKLSSFLTVPKLVGRINTIHDFVERNYAWLAPHVAFALAVRLSQVRDSQLMFQRVQVQSQEYIHNMTYSGKYGIAVERLHSGSIGFQEYVTLDSLEHLSLIKDDLFYEYTMAITIKGWPLMEKYNKVALETLQHGLYVKWETDSTDTTFDFAIERRLRQLVAGYEDPPAPQILKLANITGPIVILCVGEMCALILFLGEHLWLRYKNAILKSSLENLQVNYS